MYGVEIYATVRQLVFLQGLSRREVARRLGISRDSVAKMCRYAAPPGYVRTKPVARPKLDPLIGVIDAILEADESAPVKQRHTAKRIWQRLRDEHGFAGGYTTVKDYVRQVRVRRREVFVPLAHPPGHAQIDFGEAVGIIGGRRVKLHLFCIHLPHSDASFVKSYPSETTEALLDGLASGFAFFGGVPQSVLLDNMKLAVVRIRPDGTRERTAAFTRAVSHFVFQDRYGRPGRGNDKGKVEALVKYARRSLLTPVPSASSFADLNADLERQCLARLGETSGRQREPIGERLLADLAAFRSLPAGLFEACDMRPGRVSSMALVRYRNVDYSVPTAHAHTTVLVKGFVETVVIVAEGAEIARPSSAVSRTPRKSGSNGVDSRTKFCLYVAWKSSRNDRFAAAFRINTMERLQDFAPCQTLSIPVPVVAEFSPDAMAVREFAAQSEIDVCAKMYGLYPKFGANQGAALSALHA
jgi:transposase